MKAKNVKSVCRHKMDRFFAHVRDDVVRKTLQDNVIITGGAIASMLLGEDVHDFDIYLRTKAAARQVAEHYAKEFAANSPPRHRTGGDCCVVVEDRVDRIRIKIQSSGVASEGDCGDYQYFETTNPENADAYEYITKVLEIDKDAKPQEGEDRPKYRPVFLSSNAISLSDKVQIVIRFFGEPDEIHKNYDFVHCTNYWTSWNNQLVLRPEAIESLLARELRYVGSKYPLCSVIRARKFIQRGWACTAGQYLKMIMQLQELDLKDVDVLEEQLTGVDTAYFTEVIEALRKRDDKRVDAAYLVELIDRIF